MKPYTIEPEAPGGHRRLRRADRPTVVESWACPGLWSTARSPSPGSSWCRWTTAAHQPPGRRVAEGGPREDRQLAPPEQAAAARALSAARPTSTCRRSAISAWSGGASGALNALSETPTCTRSPSPSHRSRQRLYDTMYPERCIGPPVENAAGYRDGSRFTANTSGASCCSSTARATTTAATRAPSVSLSSSWTREALRRDGLPQSHSQHFGRTRHVAPRPPPRCAVSARAHAGNRRSREENRRPGGRGGETRRTSS